MKHETLTIWNAEDFTRPEKLAALRVGDEVAFQLKNGKDAAFVVADIADGVLTGCLFKGVRDMAMYDGRRWWNTDYVNYPESDARERLNEELLPLLPDELGGTVGGAHHRPDGGRRGVQLHGQAVAPVCGGGVRQGRAVLDASGRYAGQASAVLFRESDQPESVPVVCLAALAGCQRQPRFLHCDHVGRRGQRQCQLFAWRRPRLSHRHQGQDGGAGAGLIKRPSPGASRGYERSRA